MLGAGQKESRRTCRDWGENHVGTISEEREKERERETSGFRPDSGPSVEAMIAPRLREHRRPPSPPDRLPPRRDGHHPKKIYSVAARPPGFARLAGTRRGFLLSARALAAAACLSLLGALALPEPAAAQMEPTTLVSNIGRDVETFSELARSKVSQRFTTGSNEFGYTLSEVNIVTATSSPFMVEMCETASNGDPTLSCTPLTGPSGMEDYAEGEKSFTAPMNTPLRRDTTYAVVVNPTGIHRYQGTYSDNEDMGHAVGWSIEDSYDSNDGGQWEADDAGRSLRIAIKGTPGAAVILTLDSALPLPVSLSAEPRLPGEIRFSWWRDPDNASKDLVTSHQYRYGVRGANTLTDWITVPQTMFTLPGMEEQIRNYNSVLLKGLTPGTEYQFWVRSAGSGGYSQAVTTLGTEIDRQTVWITGPSSSVEEGKPLRFTLTRDEFRGSLDVILRTSETGDMLPQEEKVGDTGFQFQQVSFEDGKRTMPVVVETVNDRHGPEPNSDVTVEVMSYPLYPDNPDNEHLYKILPGLSEATRTVTAAVAPTCTPDPRDIWCGVVTVGELPGAYGYNKGQGVGHLSDTDFDVGTNSYTIAVLSVTKQGLPEGSGSGSLTFSINPRPGAAEHAEILGMELHVNSDRFNFSDAVAGTRGYYYWIGSVANLDWSGEDYIIARLREASSPGQVAEPLTAEFQGLPEAHDGETPFTFRIVYSEAVAVTPEAMRTRVLTVAGGAVSGAARVDGESGVWEITVTPDTREALSISLPPAADCAADGAVCTSDGRALSNGAAHIVGGPGPDTLTATFPASVCASAQHTGPSDHPQIVVAFSAPVAAFGADTPSVSATGASVDSVQRLDKEGLENAYVFFLTPEDHKAIALWLHANRACTDGGICTADRRRLSNSPSVTVAGPETGPPPLTAAFEGLPEAHDGEDAFRVRVAFSEEIGIGFRSMRDDAFTVDGGEVTGARRVDGRHDLWEITVEPDSNEAMTITLLAGRACAVSGAICTRGENRRQLANTPTATVAGPPVVPLTADFVQKPYEHDGETAFTLRIAFSEGIAIGYRRFRDQAVSATGGRVTKAKRVDRRKDLWEVTVEPDTNEAVTLTLAGGRTCGTAGAVCTGDGRALSAGISTTVLGPPGLSVADARVDEAADAVLDFAVSLSRATSGTVAVAYATADGSATAGSDYTATAGTLTFAPGETAKTVTVPVLDDAHDEGEETLTLRLTTATGAVIADGEATGTIKNTDTLQRAWLARFGRTAATHVTDAVGDRLRAGSGASHVTVGGYRLPLGQRGAMDGADDGVSGVERLVLALGQRLGLGTGTAPAGAGGVAGAGGWPDAPVATDPRLGQSRTLDVGNAVNLRQVLLGSSFRLSLGAAATGSAGPRLTAWGRVAGTTFDGREGDLSLNGDVLTGTVGVDGEWDRLLAGLAVAHSRGDGSFTKPGTDDRGRGELETTLTSIHPYLRYAVNDRLAMWGVLGYGRGHMEMELDTGETRETDMALVMGAFGGRGILLPAGETGGFELATRTDAMLTRTSSDAVAGMASADAEAHRLRLVLEGSRGFAWPEGRRLTPTMEVGLRHDWGDAETGFGLELGGRVHYADPALGLTIDAAVRGLLAHEDDDYQEWGASGSLRLAPGAGGQGLALTLAPTWGAASSGVNGLWSRQTPAGLAPEGTRQTPAGRLNAEIGYGVAAPFGTGLLTPYAGTVLSEGAARTYRVGGRLQMRGGWATGLELNLEGTRQDPAGQQPVNQGLRLQLTWGF